MMQRPRTNNLDDIHDPHDVGMVELLQHVDFPHDRSLDVTECLRRSLADDFDGEAALHASARRGRLVPLDIRLPRPSLHDDRGAAEPYRRAQLVQRHRELGRARQVERAAQ